MGGTNNREAMLPHHVDENGRLRERRGTYAGDCVFALFTVLLLFGVKLLEEFAERAYFHIQTSEDD
jgi:hypothetical protein